MIDVDDKPDGWDEWAATMRAHPPHEDVPPEGCWYACERPEDPIGRGRGYDLACRPCTVALGAAAYEKPHGMMMGSENHEWITLAEMYDWARRLHGLPRLPVRAGSSDGTVPAHG